MRWVIIGQRCNVVNLQKTGFLFYYIRHLLFLQEREEREEIEKELRAQREGLDMSSLSPSGSNNDNNNGNGDPSRGDLRTPTLSKEPPPLGLAGLEAFRREYLTSPLSHLRGGPGGLLPPFPPLGIPHSTAAALQLAAESGFGKHLAAEGGFGKNILTPPTGVLRTNDNQNHSRGGTPPASSHSTPSSEFSSQQNWSFEEQFKQVSLWRFWLLKKRWSD